MNFLWGQFTVNLSLDSSTAFVVGARGISPY